MFRVILIVFIMTFCTMGIYFFVKEIISLVIQNDLKAKIYVEINGTDENIENEIHSIIKSNPNCEIYVTDNSKNENVCEILTKLCNENASLKIVEENLQDE